MALSLLCFFKASSMLYQPTKTAWSSTPQKILTAGTWKWWVSNRNIEESPGLQGFLFRFQPLVFWGVHVSRIKSVSWSRSEVDFFLQAEVSTEPDTTYSISATSGQLWNIWGISSSIQDYKQFCPLMFGLQPPKIRSFPIKTRVIWVPRMYTHTPWTTNMNTKHECLFKFCWNSCFSWWNPNTYPPEV